MSDDVCIEVPKRVLEEWFDQLVNIAHSDVVYDEDQLVMANRVIRDSREVAKGLLEEISYAQVGSFTGLPNEKEISDGT